LEFNVPFQHKYGYIRDDLDGGKYGTLCNVIKVCHVDRLFWPLWSTARRTDEPTEVDSDNDKVGRKCLWNSVDCRD